MLQFDGNSTEIDDEMASAGKRFDTFKTWPQSSPIKPIDLVNAGFYYTGSGDEVRCFSCDLQLKGWKFSDDPFEEHRKIRANCRFVIEYEREKLGVTCNPVPASDPATGSVGVLEGHSRNNYFGNQSIISDPSYQTSYMQQQQQYPAYCEPYQSLSNITSSSGVFVTSQYPHQTRPELKTPEQFTLTYPINPATRLPSTFRTPSVNYYPGMTACYQESMQTPMNSATQQTSSIRNPSVNYPGMPLRYQESMQPTFGRGSGRNVDIPVLSPVLQHIPSVHVRTEDVHHTTSQTDLESIHQRLTTFIDWPEDCPVQPWELAAAGFYYMGTGDNVRCYKCKVQLRNWEPDDTPWAEHKRWSPDCPLVKEHEEHPRIPVEDQEQTTETQRVPPLTSPRLERFANTYTQPSNQPMRATVAQSKNEPYYGGWGEASNEEIKHPMYRPSTENMVSAVRQSNSTGPNAVPQATATITEIQSGGSLNDRDFTRVIEMGFTREDIQNAIATQTEKTGSGFGKLDDLMQALLDDSQMNMRSTPPLEEQITNPFEPQQTAANQSKPREPLQIQLNPSHSFSFDTSNLGPKRSLKRSNSAPPNALSNNPSSETVRDLDNMQEERLICKICMDAEVGVVFIPCGHISCCPPCASGLDLCPMCRKPIEQLVRTFLS